jgi:ATP-binding cassette, subfamily B, bacterial MsbA
MTTLSRREMLRGAAFRDLLPRVRPHGGTIAVASVLLVLSSAIHLAFPLVVGHLLDAAFVDADRVFLDTIALVLLGLFAIQAVLNYGQVYLLSAVGERVTGTLRTDLFSHLLALPVAFFASRRTGELTSRLTSDVGLLQNLLSHQVAEFVRQGLYLVGAIILLAITSPQLTATTLIAVPIVVGSAFFFGRRLRRSSTEVQDRVADANAVAEEAFSQIRVVQSFAQERAEVGRFAARIRESVETALERAQYRGVFFGVITFVAFGAVVMVLWQGGRLVLTGELTAGMLVAFLLYAVTVAASVGTLATLWSRYQEASGAALRVFELLESPSDITSPKEAVALPRPLRGEIRFARVSFRYDSPDRPRQQLATQADTEEDGWVLCDIDLEVAAGETVALVGPSGAGKTTLVSLLPRFWDPQRGAITLDGLELGALSLRELREAIGIVPQETPLFSGTIRENIAYGRPDASEEEIREAARAANAEEFIARLPRGYDTRVGERGIKLSGGQRQRVAIARALLKDPAVLILDEATSNLDAESEGLIEEALDRLLVGRTTLIIAHRLSTARRADRLVVLDRGRIVEEGSHESLVARGGLYARLAARQFPDAQESGESTVDGSASLDHLSRYAGTRGSTDG